MKKFKTVKRNCTIILIFMVLTSFFMLAFTTSKAQRFRSDNVERVNSSTIDVNVKINDDYKYEFELVDKTNKRFPFHAQRIILHVYFTDGEALTLTNEMWSSDPDPNITYFMTTKKQSKMLRDKEIKYWKFVLLNGETIYEQPAQFK